MPTERRDEETVKVRLSGSCRVRLEREMMVTPEEAEELKQLVRDNNDEELATWFDWTSDIVDGEADEIDVMIVDGKQVYCDD